MKTKEVCWLTNWQVRFLDPDIEYGARRPEVVGTFLAITERKNCVLKPEYRNAVLIGDVFNYPGGEFENGTKIITPNIIRIEHKLLTEGIERRMKLLKSIFGQKFTLDRREKKFATFVETESLTFMLGYIGQRLISSADPINWDMLQGSRGYDPYSYDDGSCRKGFEKFTSYFDNINEDFLPIDLEE